MLVSLVQVGDMRAAWKKMKAAGITSDIGLRYAYISRVKASGSVPCCCCLNTICCLGGACKNKKLMLSWLFFWKMSISHCVSHTPLIVPFWLYSLDTDIAAIACLTQCHADGIVHIVPTTPS